jgi:sulfoxide reductase heme-binding subunit YedZ
MAFLIKKLWLITLVICLFPLPWLFIDAVTNNLGANPIEAVHIRLGDWALRFLWITLAITPIQTITKWRGMSDYRQLFGLYAFLYATLHLLVYLVVDQSLMWRLIIIDIIESPYILFGMLAYVIIFLLAITSSKYSKKRLGKNWKKLHRFIYLSSAAAMIHYFWQLKGNLLEPIFYLTILSLLLGFRVLVWLKNRQFTKMMIPKRRE